MVDKEQVKRSFSRAASTYDEHSGVQRQIAGMLLERISICTAIDARSVRTVVDIGCGTGWLTSRLAGIFKGASVAGTDIALPMLDTAGAKYTQLSGTLVNADCESLPFRNASIDAAVSNMTYQWSEDLSAAFAEAGRVLGKGGILGFTTLGPATLNELAECYAAAAGAARGPIKYRSAREVAAILTGCGFEVLSAEEVMHAAVYENVWELVRSIKKIGASPATSGPGATLASGTVLKEAQKIYEDKYPAPDGCGITATYDVIIITARKVS